MESHSPKTQPLTLTSLLSFVKQGWKILVIAVILGGSGGLAFSYVLPPEYEAEALFSFSIDYARTGLLTDIEEDQAMEVAGDLINSTGVMEILRERALEIGLSVEPENLRSHLTAERRFNQWLLKVRWDDPEKAAKFANLWSEAARTALENARQAAWKADSLHRYILSLESCFQQSTAALPAQPVCQASNRSELQAEMEKSGADKERWTAESQGIFPGLNFSWDQEAAVPDAPLQNSRGSLVLAGCLAGLSVAMILSLFILKI